MKKHIKLEWVYIAVLVISLILSIVTGIQIAGEVVNVRRNLSEQNMGMNAFLFNEQSGTAQYNGRLHRATSQHRS